MGLRKKIKTFFRKTLSRTKSTRPTQDPPSTPANILPTDRANFYNHSNHAINTSLTLQGSMTDELATAVYMVQGRTPAEWRARGGMGIDDIASIDDISIADSEIPTASDYSDGELTRMTELALGAHQEGTPLRDVEPRPLPEVPGEVVMGKRRGIRILTGEAMRKVKGLRMFSGGKRTWRWG